MLVNNKNDELTMLPTFLLVFRAPQQNKQDFKKT